MRAVIIGLAVALVSVPVHAQQAPQNPAQTMKTFASSADVAALIAKLGDIPISHEF